MIYIITPFLTDFKSTCVVEGFDCPIQGGRIMNPNFVWVHDWMQLHGRRISKVDKIIYGQLVHRFDSAMLERIKLEIEIRRNHG